MEQLREMIRRLPVGVEFLIVVSWAFGQFIFASIMSIGVREEQTYTNHALLSVLVGELMQFAFLIWFLRVRGWTLEKFGLRFTLRGTGGGLLLAGASFALFIVAQIIGGLVLPIDMKSAEVLYPKTAQDLDMQLVFITSVVNGAYEELFVAGYIIAVLAPIRGMWTAINVSTGIRLLYHLYQGPIGVITIVPLGILYGYVFARTRQLWPLIVAHIVIDVVGLSFATR
jgi:uncharacterized protein